MCGRKKGEWWDRVGQTGRQAAIQAIQLYSASQKRLSSGQSDRKPNSNCPMRNVFVWCVLKLYGINVSQSDVTSFVRYLVRSEGERAVSRSRPRIHVSPSFNAVTLPLDPAVVRYSQLKVSVDIMEDGTSLNMLRFEIDPLLQMAPFLFDVRLEEQHSPKARLVYDAVWSLVPNSELKVYANSTSRPGVIPTTLTPNDDKYARGQCFNIPWQELGQLLGPTVGFFRVEHHISLSRNAILLNNLLSTAFNHFPFITSIQVIYHWARVVPWNPHASRPPRKAETFATPCHTTDQGCIFQGSGSYERHTPFDIPVPIPVESPSEAGSTFRGVARDARPFHRPPFYTEHGALLETSNRPAYYPFGDISHTLPSRIPFHEGLILPFVSAEDGGLVAALSTY